MHQSISYPTPERQTPTEPAATPRLRTITGNRFPRKCACGCGLGIPRDPEIRYVLDFGDSKPYRAYLLGITKGVKGPWLLVNRTNGVLTEEPVNSLGVSLR